MLYTEHHTKSPQLSQIALALVVVGAIFTTIGSILIIFGYSDFVLAGWYSGIGFALIGILAGDMFSYTFLHGNVLPHNLVIFGIVAGVFMATGLLGIPGIIRWNRQYGVHAVVSLRFVFWVARNLYSYPIWTIWLGRFLLSR